MKLLRCGLWIYWSPTVDRDAAKHAERSMIDVFEAKVGRLPFATRIHPHA